jgi:hypothetical protein
MFLITLFPGNIQSWEVISKWFFEAECAAGGTHASDCKACAAGSYSSAAGDLQAQTHSVHSSSSFLKPDLKLLNAFDELHTFIPDYVDFVYCFVSCQIHLRLFGCKLGDRY